MHLIDTGAVELGRIVPRLDLWGFMLSLLGPNLPR